MVRTESTERRWKGKAIVASHNDDGDRIPSEYNAEDSRGSPLNDVWYVPIVAPSGHERSGYPTQKTEALLEKFIQGNSNPERSEEHTSELQSLMRISYAVFCLKKKNKCTTH